MWYRFINGQKQRVAIARALANRPAVLLCDEPTSALDTNTTAEVLHVLQSINDNFGVTIVIVSHELEVVEIAAIRSAIMTADREAKCRSNNAAPIKVAPPPISGLTRLN